MFEFSFLTILNTYKDYFEGCKRWWSCTRVQFHKCEEKCDRKPSLPWFFFLLKKLLCFVYCRILWLRNFMIFIVWWIEELCSQHPSQVAYWDSRNWLVTCWEPCIKRRDCHYRTCPTGYWGKGSIVGWYKVLRFLYL